MYSRHLFWIVSLTINHIRQNDNRKKKSCGNRPKYDTTWHHNMHTLTKVPHGHVPKSHVITRVITCRVITCDLGQQHAP